MAEQDKQSAKPSLAQVIGSVFAAAFGVQSDANRQRDFAQGSAATYIIAGLIFTILFIMAIVAVVKTVVG